MHCAWFKIERVESKREANRSAGARDAEICAHVTCKLLAKGVDLRARPLIDSSAAEDLVQTGRSLWRVARSATYSGQWRDVWEGPEAGSLARREGGSGGCVWRGTRAGHRGRALPLCLTMSGYV